MTRWTMALAVLAWTATAQAETKTFEITVAAGKHDRMNTPVRVQVAFDLPKAVRSVVLEDAAGTKIPGQITEAGLGEPMATAPEGKKLMPVQYLHFILPNLKAGETAKFKVSVSTDAPAREMAFAWSKPDGEAVELSRAGRPILRYMYKALDDSSPQARELTYKVFHHLYDPTGKRLVTKGSGGQYTHHRGLFYGFNKITLPDGKSADIWHCTGETHQAHAKFEANEVGPVLGRQQLLINWNGPGKKTFAREERELTVLQVPGGTLVEFRSVVGDTKEPLKFDGDPQHAGFHFRADNEVSAKTSKETYFLRPDGAGKKGESRNWPMDKKHVDLPWNAMSFVLGEQRYTMAYLDSPKNPKEARFSERPYGRIGSYFEYRIGSNGDGTFLGDLAVTYRIWLQEGEMQGSQVAALAADFVEPPQVTVK